MGIFKKLIFRIHTRSDRFQVQRSVFCFPALFTCIASCLLLFSFTSCKKSELPEPESLYHKVRIYDDTLPDPRNHSIRIAAGQGRLLMTYGHTFEELIVVAGLGAASWPPPAENVWMLTDNDGNIIRRDAFPSGLSIGDIISL